MNGDHRSFLLVLGERRGIAWVLRTGCMAFHAGAIKKAQQLRVGDELFLYASRGAFGNPTQHRGQVMAVGAVASPVRRLEPTVRIGEGEFDCGCDITLAGLAPFQGGQEMAPLVSKLSIFPNPRAWSARLRTTLVELPAADARFLRRKVQPTLQPPPAVIDEYLRWGVPPGALSGTS